MTVNEFKAWLEGYTEEMKGSPNQKQWKRIQEKLSEVNETASYIPWNPPTWVPITIPTVPYINQSNSGSMNINRTTLV